MARVGRADAGGPRRRVAATLLATFPFSSMRRTPIIAIALIFCTLLRVVADVARAGAPDGRVRSAALRAWFVLLAGCAVLSRHVRCHRLRGAGASRTARSAAAAHARMAAHDGAAGRAGAADVRVKTPLNEDGGLAMFRVAAPPSCFQEFADAKTIIRLNARSVGRDVAALRPGDLIYFHQPSQNAPDHLMVFVGSSSVRAGRPRLGGLSHAGLMALGPARCQGAPARSDASPSRRVGGCRRQPAVRRRVFRLDLL